MKVVFISNYMNHYQLAFAESMKKKGIDYWFVSTYAAIPEERRKLGFSDKFHELDYVLNAVRDSDKVDELIRTSDLVITSYVGLNLVSERVLRGQITFLETERLFKKTGNGIDSFIKNYLRRIKYTRKLSMLIKSESCYFLLIGNYAVRDHILCGVRPDKIMKFAYFPAKSSYENRNYTPKGRVRLLWAGRLIKWKHPERAVSIVKKMQEEGHDVHLTVIGTGPMEATLVKMSYGYNIELIGSVPFSKVRQYMHDADIFLFTSDYEEGWGCVLNEAMSEGDAVVASSMAGSTTFLIKNGVNGITYDGSEEQLYHAVKSYITNRELIAKYGIAGRETIEKKWNSDIAADNLITQFSKILHGEEPDEIDGPCGLYEEI